MCVSVALVIQHAMRARHTVLSSVVCPALQYFSTSSHKLHHFRRGEKKVIEQKMCVLFCRYPSQALMKLEFPGQIFEKYSNIKLH